MLSLVVLLLTPIYTIANQCGYLYITESAENKHFILNWNYTCDDRPDTIILSSNDPTGNDEINILASISTKELISGYHTTDFFLTDNTLPGNWSLGNNSPDINARCFPYYIASYRNNSLIDHQCFAIQPAWMMNFQDLKIHQILIPGTHNSGAYTSPFPDIMTNWILTQNRNFWEQLVYGIRFMDIRVGRYGEPPNGTYINHGLAQCTELMPELQSVQEFLLKSPNEIVILNFHAFPFPENFTDEYHQEVLNMLQNVFTTNIQPYSETTLTLKDCVDSGKRVLISYNEAEIVQKNSWLWPEITRYWGNKVELKDLEEYIKSTTNVTPAGNPMSSIMAQLTPDSFYIATHLDKSLRYMADLVNRELDGWIRNDDRFKNINIIATDYFTGTDMVNIAIEANKIKIS